jgi:hypothetical protein
MQHSPEQPPRTSHEAGKHGSTAAWLGLPQPRAHQREVNGREDRLVVAERAALVARVAAQVLPALLPCDERRAARGRHGRMRCQPALQAPDESG